MVEQLPWADIARTEGNGDYNYEMPVNLDCRSIETELVAALAETTAFRRLGDVRFLGALDYFLVASPNATSKRYTRLQHSLGVATLAQSYLGMKKHTPQQRLLCIAAAALHDIGHPPFSHTLEPVFERAFQFDHHRASERIISGQTPLGDEVVSVLRSFGVDPLAVLDVLNGGDALYDSFFSGPINFDTIEGILRARKYLKMQELGLSPLKVMRAAANRDLPLSRDIVDCFWQSKHEVYTLVIRSRLGVFYDGLFQAIASRCIDEFSPLDYFSSEANIFKKAPLLRDALKADKLNAIARNVLPPEIHYQARRFFVDSDTSFASRNDKQRYRQSKHPASLTLSDILPA